MLHLDRRELTRGSETIAVGPKVFDLLAYLVQNRDHGQLIDATTGGHLWADRFEGTIGDVFELQDQMTESVGCRDFSGFDLQTDETAVERPTCPALH